MKLMKKGPKSLKKSLNKMADNAPVWSPCRKIMYAVSLMLMLDYPKFHSLCITSLLFQSDGCQNGFLACSSRSFLASASSQSSSSSSRYNRSGGDEAC